MSNPTQWLKDLGNADLDKRVDGLIPVEGYEPAGRPPEEVAIMHKASYYGANAVFFEAARNDRPPIAQAFIFDSSNSTDDESFAEKHKRLWSWGGVPLLYRKTSGLVQLFRCAHKADFFSPEGKLICNPIRTLELAGAISADPWWDASRLRNGTLWDDTSACKTLISAKDSAYKGVIGAVKELSDELNAQNVLPTHLRRKLLILSLLIAYLEERDVFNDGYLGRFLPGATKFFEVLAEGAALVALIAALEVRFNGHVFVLSEPDRERLKNSDQLVKFARLIEGRDEKGGQRTLWQRYSFKDLPVELISHIYQLFVKDASSSVYTPPFLVRLILEESLSWKRLDLLKKDEIILDPCCGSGIFLVEAYKRLVLHWRSKHNWAQPDKEVLQDLLTKVHGIDLDGGAVELAAFSLCLALCDALEPADIRASVKLFPPLVNTTLHTRCFFEAKEEGLVTQPVGVAVGNPPFTSKLNTPAAKRSYERYEKTYGSLPDKQLAYLFLHEAMEMVADGGVLSMLQQYNFLYNQWSLDFRRNFIGRWDVREVLDFISVRGLFKRGDADTKVIVVVAESTAPPEDRKILHATFRRSGRVEAEQGFDIDYYDLHWLPRELALTNDSVWRADLLGGGRVLGFVDRLKQYRTLGEFTDKPGWDVGEGFIAAKKGKLVKAPHITGERVLRPRHLEESADLTELERVEDTLFKSPYTRRRFQSPMVLIHQNENLRSRTFLSGYYTYKDKIVGFCAPTAEADTVEGVARWLKESSKPLKAFVTAGGRTTFTQKSSWVGLYDIKSLPYPETGTLDISPNEEILIDDIVDYQRDFIRLGDDSPAMKENGHAALPAFASVFCRQINGIYTEKPLRALEPQTWPGAMCQPFVFGEGQVDWSNADELKDKLGAILRERQSPTLQVTRIGRIYDGSFVFLLKPDQLRYWLRSVALRDADETLDDLRLQGF